MTASILITGARAAAAVDIARDFARAGFEVHMADCATARIARCSNAVAAVHTYLSPVQEPAGFRAAVTALVGRLDPALVIPTCEEVFHLAACNLGLRLFAPPRETLRQLHDKLAFARLCETAGLPVPETHEVTDPARFAETSRDWVFKARFSRFGEGVRVGPTDLSGIGPGWIAQRRITGREVSFYAVAHAGKIAAFAAYQSAWRLPGGASLTFDAADADLLPLAQTLAAATNLTGQFACDLIVDEAGQPYFIECNPRATSGAHLLTGAGDFARAMLTPPPTPLLQTPGPQHLLPALATFGLAEAIRTRRLPQWLTQFRTGRDVAGRPGDRLPMFGAMADGIGFMLTGARRGISATAAATHDIEWNGDPLP